MRHIAYPLIIILFGTLSWAGTDISYIKHEGALVHFDKAFENADTLVPAGSVLKVVHVEKAVRDKHLSDSGLDLTGVNVYTITLQSVKNPAQTISLTCNEAFDWDDEKPLNCNGSVTVSFAHNIVL